MESLTPYWSSLGAHAPILPNGTDTNAAPMDELTPSHHKQIPTSQPTRRRSEIRPAQVGRVPIPDTH